MILDFKEMSLEDKTLFDNFFNRPSLNLSEFTFTNLFVWSDYRKIKYSLYEDGLIIFAKLNNESYFFPPIGYENINDYAINDIFRKMLEYKMDSNFKIKINRVPEVYVNSLDKKFFNIVEDRDNFDYVYSREELIQLKGRKFALKRNFVSNFFENYEFEYLQYSDKYYDGCLSLAKEWLAKHNNSTSTQAEFNAIIKLLDNYSHFSNIRGAVLIIDSRVVAFAFGEKLNNDTFVIHFEKGNIDYIGIYQTINKLFIENEVDKNFLYINREQDLGIEGIRKAKESYNPVYLVKKYSVDISLRWE